MSAVVKLVEENCQGLDRYEKYNFIIALLGNTQINFSCPAKQDTDAWLLAARQASAYNMPCMSITYKGKE